MSTATRFDVIVSIFCTEHPLLERPSAASDAGFDAVACWWPFATPTPPDQDVDAFIAALAAADVQLVGLNFDAGDVAPGSRGLVSQPEHPRRFRDDVAMLADLYHLARMEQDRVAVLRTDLDRIGHVRIADVPDRNRPGTGDLALDGVLAALDAGGFTGYVGRGYRRSAPSAHSFDWLPRDGRASLTCARRQPSGGTR